jgi:proton-translocating NADH-quinone oxidoreductase chain L
MSNYEQFLAIGVVVPLISFTILAFFGHRIGKPLASVVATAAIGVSAALGLLVFIGWLNMDEAARTAASVGAARFHWATLGSMPITIGVKLDSLTVAMYCMVTFIAFWIHFFSIGYMAGHSDEVDGQCKYHRFFAYLSLFCFSMLGLVISSNLMFMFMFWELVGLCSYLLIGFYFDKKFASDAGMKAFITNRVGDFGFIAGMMLMVLYLGTLDLDQASVTFELAAHQAHAAPLDHHSAFARGWLECNADSAIAGTSSVFVEQRAETAAGLFQHTTHWWLAYASLATLMGLGLFCGCLGKSAQLPLQVWLPDAMAGPTPVSALIHAATMVAAGVYLVARVYRLLTPQAQIVIAVIGCLTLTMAALIAIVQTDIKKVLAYSTLSQLGYMVFGLGVGSWIGALFHLITHAFFKAMLFLGSGQVIEGCHHEQDIRKMGGLYKKMPMTCVTFLVGVLAISGFGVPGLHLGLGGYFSKDEILAVAWDRTNMWEFDTTADSHGDGHAAPAHGSPADDSHDEGDGGDHAAPANDGGGHSAADVPVQGAHGLVLSASATADDGEHHGNVHDHDARQAIMSDIPALPKWMFYLPLIIAYVTPFYMMRVFWLTFGGQPRDHHVYDHAHESKMMWVPLIVLAAGTVFASYFCFRTLLADAAPMESDAAMIVSLDGVAVTADGGHVAGTELNVHAAHDWLWWGVGWSWAIGIALAWLMYRGGLGIAARFVKWPVISGAHHVLEKKFYFDEVYNAVLVMGTRGVAVVSSTIDKYLVDGFVNFVGRATQRFADMTGRQLDMPVERGDLGLVDAIVNGVASAAMMFGNWVRRPQLGGHIRTYLMMAAGSAAIVLLVVLFGEQIWSFVASWGVDSQAVTAMR